MDPLSPKPPRDHELTRLYVAVGLGVIIWLIFKIYKLLSAQVGIGLDAPSRWALLALGLANVLAIGTLLFIVARSLAKLYFERRSGILGARIRTRLVLAFLAISIAPSLMLFLAGRNFISKNVDRWFNPQTQEAIQDSHILVEQLREQHHRRLKTATNLALHQGNREVSDLLRLLDVDAIALKDSQGKLKIAVKPGVPAPTAELPLSLDSTWNFPEGMWILEPILDVKGRQMGWAGIFSPSVVSESIARLDMRYREGFQGGTFKETLETLGQRSFLFLALLIIFAAVWVGLALSRTIAEPVRALAKAAQRVGMGDLEVALPEHGEDELALLSRSFNAMTRDLRIGREAIEDQWNRIERQRAYLNQLLEALPVGVLSWQADGELRTFNSTAHRWLGLDDYDPIQHPWSSLAQAPRMGELPALVEMVRQTHRPRQEELRIGGEGEGRPVRAIIVPLMGGGELAVLEDLSLLAHAEKQAAWQEVARRMAHEVKNPLTPIKLTAQRLARRSMEGHVDPALVKEGAETILHEVNSLSRLVDSFSRFAKLPSLQPTPLDPCELLRQVVALYSPVQPGIAWSLDLPENCTQVRWDNDMVKRALINLVDNAISAQEGRGRIRLALTPEYEGVRLSVEDEGPGVPQEGRERLFEPYFSTKKKGTGLGLAIVRKIANDHGGEAYYEPLPNGSLFSLWLPNEAPEGKGR